MDSFQLNQDKDGDLTDDEFEQVPFTHQLNSNWKMWVRDRADTNKDFEKSLHHLFTANTVESFFSNYVYLSRPSELKIDYDLFFFREKEKPMWETSPEGGTLILKFPRSHEKLDLFWEMLLFMCIGEIQQNLNIIGVAASLRQNNDAYMQIWTKKIIENCPDYYSKLIKQYLKLTDSDNCKMFFKKHSNALNDNSTIKNAEVIGRKSHFNDYSKGRAKYYGHSSRRVKAPSLSLNSRF